MKSLKEKKKGETRKKREDFGKGWNGSALILKPNAGMFGNKTNDNESVSSSRFVASRPPADYGIRNLRLLWISHPTECARKKVKRNETKTHLHLLNSFSALVFWNGGPRGQRLPLRPPADDLKFRLYSQSHSLRFCKHGSEALAEDRLQDIIHELRVYRHENNILTSQTLTARLFSKNRLTQIWTARCLLATRHQNRP